MKWLYERAATLDAPARNPTSLQVGYKKRDFKDVPACNG